MGQPFTNVTGVGGVCRFSETFSFQRGTAFKYEYARKVDKLYFGESPTEFTRSNPDLELLERNYFKKIVSVNLADVKGLLP